MLLEIFKKYLENNYQNDKIITSLSRSLSSFIADFFISNASIVININNNIVTLSSFISGSSPLNLNISVNQPLLLYNLRTNETFSCYVISNNEIELIDANTDIEINDRIYDLTDFYNTITLNTPEIIKLKNYSSPQYASSVWLDFQGLKYNVPRNGLPDTPYSQILNYYPLAHYSGKYYEVSNVLNTLFEQSLSYLNYFENPEYKNSLELIYNDSIRISPASNIGQSVISEYVFAIPDTSTELPALYNFAHTLSKPQTIQQATEIKGILVNVGDDQIPYSTSFGQYHTGYYVIDTLTQLQALYGSVTLDAFSKSPYRNLFPLQYYYFIHRSQYNYVYLLSPYYVTNYGFINNHPFIQWEMTPIQNPYIKSIIITEIEPNQSFPDSTNLSDWNFGTAKSYFIGSNLTQYTSSNTYINTIGIIIQYLLEVPESIVNQLYGSLKLLNNVFVLGEAQSPPYREVLSISYPNPYKDLSLMPGVSNQFVISDPNLPNLSSTFTFELSYYLDNSLYSLPKNLVTVNFNNLQIPLISIDKNNIISLGYLNSNNSVITTSTGITFNALQQYDIALVKNNNVINLFLDGTSSFVWNVSSVNNNISVSSYVFDLAYGSLDNVRLTNSVLYTTNYTSSNLTPDPFVNLPSSPSNEVFRFLFNDIYLNNMTTSTITLFNGNYYITADVSKLSYGPGFNDTDQFPLLTKGVIHVITY